MPALVPEWETRYQSVDSSLNVLLNHSKPACSVGLIGIPDIIVTNAMVLMRNLRAHDKNLPKSSDSFQFCKQYKVPWRRAINGIQIRFTPYHSTRRYHQQSKSLQLGCSRNIWAISTFTDWSIENRDSDIFFLKSYKSNQKNSSTKYPRVFCYWSTILFAFSLNESRLWRQNNKRLTQLKAQSWNLGPPIIKKAIFI